MVNDLPAEFVRRMNAAQQPLFAYILSVVPRAADAQDILGETNLALWKKREEYNLSADFWPWACRFAQLQIKAHRQKAMRDRHVFGVELAERLTSELTSRLAQIDERQLALDDCIAELEQRQAQLVGFRYREGLSVQAIAAETGKSDSAVKDALYRIRLALARCVHRRLALGGGSPRGR